MRARAALASLLAAAALASCTHAPPPVAFAAEGRPQHLSDWHVLNVAAGRLAPNADVLPYDLVTPLFSDYAHKLRTVWMPKGVSAAYSPDKAFDFPVGTILSKTFYYPRADGQAAVRQTYDAEPGAPAAGLELARVRLVETRLLVRRADGWAVLPYVWNADQTDAELARTGDTQALELVDAQGARRKFTYVVPDENQCASCHVTDLRSGGLTPLGPKARNLNRTLAYADGAENQVARWVRTGYLRDVPSGELPRAADWRDASLPLDRRARSYLDVNCAHCHQAGATASNTALRLDAAGPADWSLGLCKPSVAAGKGTGDRVHDIEPGRPDASILPFRLASTEGGVMMPELGRSTVHQEGVQLIRDWISAMPGHCDTEPRPTSP